MNCALIWNESPDKYGNDAMVVQQVSKEERQNGVKGNILGNARNINPKPENKPSSQPPESYPDEQPLPF